MNIDSAIESFLAWISKVSSDFPLDLPIFYMGEDTDIANAVSLIEMELRDELITGIPFPFEGQLLFLKLDLSIPFEERARIHSYEYAKNGLPLWLVSMIRKHPTDKQSLSLLSFAYSSNGGWQRNYAGGGRLMMVGDDNFAFGEYGDAVMAHPTIPGASIPSNSNDNVAHNIRAFAYYLALISHPANYIVRETPSLTPKEQRRVAAGKRFPDAKRSRYIIVDHDVLVNRIKPQGTHASPVPHQRRGHWRKLAERCKLARARGAVRVRVRDCDIGETDFIVNNRRYQVLMDFHSRYGDRENPQKRRRAE